MIDGDPILTDSTSHQTSREELNESFDRMAEGSVVRQVIVFCPFKF